MMQFGIGDRVAVLDDVGEGEVMAIHNDQITVLMDEGFELYYAASELVRTSTDTSITVSNFEIAQIKKQKELPKRKKSIATKVKERSLPKMEVDLHIQKLTTKHRGMSNYDMLNLQLDTAQRQLHFAVQKRIQKVVFIHGVGEGVLKEELYFLFRKYENIRYYDADYQKYGLGATEVYISQNS